MFMVTVELAAKRNDALDPRGLGKAAATRSVGGNEGGQS
jgi:hypothetical protein